MRDRLPAAQSAGLLPLLSVSLLGVLGAASGCQSLNAPLYFKGDLITANTADTPLASGGLTLRFRNPTNGEQTDLDAQTASTDYGGDIPWISADKIHLELSYRVTNMSATTEAKFNVMVDGASQYAKYDSKTAAAALQQGNNDDPTYLPLMKSGPMILAPNASYTGLLREDDFREAELDLDALGRWNDADGKTFAAVLLNRSDVYPRGTEPLGMGLVPGFRVAMGGVGADPARLVVPAFVEVDVNLLVEKTDNATDDATLTCEYLLRVRDDDDRLLHDDKDTLFETSPTLFAPAVM
jgi:hypothetical protein